MKILVAHTNYPAQFRRLLPHWAESGHDVVFLARSKEWHAPDPDGYRVLPYSRHRDGINSSQHPYLNRFESAIIEGQAVVRSAINLVNEGWHPDFVINHVGFGSGLFLKQLFPAALKISLFEWFYNPFGSDVDFLPPHNVSLDHQCKMLVWKTEMLQELTSSDIAVVPTNWQKQQFPSIFHPKLRVIHEGIPVSEFSSYVGSAKDLFDFLPDDKSIKVLTYVSRCIESYRGFQQALEAISELQVKFQNLHVLLVVTALLMGPRGQTVLSGQIGRELNLHLDPLGTHWLGSLQEDQYRAVLSVSTVHMYLTVPFILSWSLLEAMASGCAIVASSTSPVQEVLVHRKSALLVDFFDVSALVSSVSELLCDQSLRQHLASNAKAAAQPFSSEAGCAAWDQLLES